MREIKFRVYIESPDGEKGMHYPKLISFGCGKLSWATLEDETLLKDNGWHTKREVMQYTGIRGVDEKEVYEGDIVDVLWPEDNEVWKNAEITWCDAGFRILYDGIEYDAHHMRYDKQLSDIWSDRTNMFVKVVGNIYENPELVK